MPTTAPAAPRRVSPRPAVRPARPQFRALAAGALLAAAAACGGGDGPTGPGGAAGTYTLRTVNGAALPAVVAEVGGDRAEVTAGAVTLNANATYTSTMSVRTTIGGVTTTQALTASGRYAVSGSTVTFTDGSGEASTATLSGDTITAETETDDGTLTAVYRK